MQASFSFCGVDIKSIGLEYAPEMENTYVYAPGETNVHEETFDGHSGGYYYGAWTQPKQFQLRCYFESKQIDHGVMANIYELFRVGRAGKLVFSRRPWCYYNARVTAPVETDFTNYLNGLVVITMTAYFPFAKCDIMYDTHSNKQILTNTGLFDSADKVPTTLFENIDEDIELTILSNPGTEPTPVAISITGDIGDGIEITNVTTGQKCSFVNITDEVTPVPASYDDVYSHVVCDGLNGKTVLIDEHGNVSNGALYHNEGFISLEPSFPIERDVYIKEIDNKTISLYNTHHNNYEGQYIFIDGVWYKIVSQPDEHTLILKDAFAGSNYKNKTTIARMNEIRIHFIGTHGTLRRLEFIYKPLFA